MRINIKEKCIVDKKRITYYITLVVVILMLVSMIIVNIAKSFSEVLT